MPSTKAAVKVGAFYLKHKASGKLLLGVTSDLKSTINSHLENLRDNKHKNTELLKLYKANSDIVIKTYPTENLDEARDLVTEMANILRRDGLLLNYKYDNTQSRDQGTIEKIRLSSIGRKQSQEAKDKISAANKGRVISSETRAKLRISSSDRILTPEIVAKMQEARRNSPTYGEQLKRIADIGKARSLKVNASGVIFNSIKETAQHFGISPQAVRRRLDSTTDKFKDWSYA